MIPFFVVDRPMSLRILKGLPLQKYSHVRIGLMTHAYTSSNFQKKFKEYPCDNLEFCDAIGKPCPYSSYKERLSECQIRRDLLAQTVKMCDSGIFIKEGTKLSYPQLFEKYQNLGVDYGIITDTFRDSKATLESAKEAIKVFHSQDYTFELVGVAQGRNITEYLDCYKELRSLGYHYVAVGGLLYKSEETVRFNQVAQNEQMFSILDAIRENYEHDWLFALGCFSVTRRDELKRRNVWADHKGWIFRYRKRNEVLNGLVSKLQADFDTEETAAIPAKLKSLLQVRNKLLNSQKSKHKTLIAGKRVLRKYLRRINRDLQNSSSDFSASFSSVTTKAILDATERNKVAKALKELKLEESDFAEEVFKTISENIDLKSEIDRYEAEVEEVNSSLGQLVSTFLCQKTLPSEVRTLLKELEAVIQSTENEYRLSQIRQNVEMNILEHI